MAGQYLFALLLLVGAFTPSASLPDNVFKDHTVAEVWRGLIRGQEDTVRRAILEKWPENHMNDQVIKMADALTRQDEQDCSTCEIVVNVLKGLVNLFGYDRVEETIIGLCDALLNVRHDVFCQGVIQHQGPHLWAAIDGSGSADFCEHINLCVPAAKTVYNKPPARKSQKMHNEIHKHSRGSPSRLHRQSRSADLLKVVQLADVHIEPKYAEGSPTDCGLNVCCFDEWAEDPDSSGYAGEWGDYNCNVPQKTVNLFLDKIHSDIKPDFIVYTGDSPPHSIWEETQESQLNSTRLLVQSLTDHVPGVPVYTNIGNHEMYPTNIYRRGLSHTDEMSDEFVELWSPLANFGSDQEGTLREGGYYSKLQRDGLRLLALNTNFMYLFNWYNVINWINQTEAQEMLVFLEEQLENARDNNEKVILIGHHPPGGADFITSKSQWFIDLAQEYKDVIVLHIAGHTHTNEFRLVMNSDSSGADHVVITSPSIDSNGRKNPSARVFYLDPDSFRPVDYDHYYLDISPMPSIFGSEEPEIALMYSASEEYGLEDLTAQSYADLVHEMETNDELLQKHHQNRNARATPESTCDDTCKTNLLCKLRTASFDQYTACINREPGISTTTTPPQETDDPPSGAAGVSASLFCLLMVTAFHKLLL